MRSEHRSFNVICEVQVGNPFLNRRTLTNAGYFIIHRGFNLRSYFSVPEGFPRARVWCCLPFLICTSCFIEIALWASDPCEECSAGWEGRFFSQHESQQLFEETSSLGHSALLSGRARCTIMKCFSGVDRVLKPPLKLQCHCPLIALAIVAPVR